MRCAESARLGGSVSELMCGGRLGTAGRTAPRAGENRFREGAILLRGQRGMRVVVVIFIAVSDPQS
jgi:hypothetical protein